MTNPCLRPASLSDAAYQRHQADECWWSLQDDDVHAGLALQRLYNAEWRLRGFERSP